MDQSPAITRFRPLHIATFLLFIGMLIAPWIAGLFGASSDTVERRLPVELPDLGGDSLLEVQTFAGINEFVSDRTPLRGNATSWVNQFWLQFGASGDLAVVEGPGEYFFLAEDFTQPCSRNYELDDMVDQFVDFRESAENGGKEFLFLVASDKGAILDDQLTGRAAIAAECSREARPEFREALDSTGTSFDLAPALIAAEQADPGRWYYEHDSHWTFEGGGIVAEQIVNHFDDGLFDPENIGTLQRALPINGDVYRRLGISRNLEVPDPVLASIRPDTTTDRVETQIGGTRTIRSYRNTGSDQFIEGRTIAVHDSMMNFAERQLASYFEEIVFIHWDDLELANFIFEVAESDRVIMMNVERDVHNTIRADLLDEEFGQQFTSALENERAEPDDLLPEELIAGADALRNFTSDTGEFAQAFTELLADPGIDGWAGPYLSGELYDRGVHPRYGLWRTVQVGDSAPGTITECSEFNTGDCATWLLLADTPVSIAITLDREFDDGDGLTSGRVRWTGGFEILYFYSLA